MYLLENKIKKLALNILLLSTFWIPAMAVADSNEMLQSLGSKIQAGCHTPERGPPGMRGPHGHTGATGPTGPTANGAIIPYASGMPITLTVNLEGTPSMIGAVGFGSSAFGPVTPPISSLDIIGFLGGLVNFDYAFSMPRDGTLTALSAYFSTPGNILNFPPPSTQTVTITAQLYQSTIPNNTFTPIPGAVVNLSPSFTGSITAGAIAHGVVSGLSIPVTTETRLLLVFYASSAQTFSSSITVTGYASGGLSIE